MEISSSQTQETCEVCVEGPKIPNVFCWTFQGYEFAFDPDTGQVFCSGEGWGTVNDALCVECPGCPSMSKRAILAGIRQAMNWTDDVPISSWLKLPNERLFIMLEKAVEEGEVS